MFSMIVTISAWTVTSEMLDSPEAVITVDTIPWPTVMRASSSSIPWDTAAWSQHKADKAFEGHLQFLQLSKIPLENI